MANGTAGLGLNTQVFDFSGISELGLQIDQINEAKAEKKSAKFQAGNKDLSTGVDMSGVRSVDKPFLQKKTQEFMDLSAQAFRTEDPAVAAQARELKSQISERVQISSTLQSSDFQEVGKFRESEDKDYYLNELSEHSKATAMTEENPNIDPTQARYIYVPSKDLIKGSLSDEAIKYSSVISQNATISRSVTDKKGASTAFTRTDKEVAAAEADKAYDSWSNTAEGSIYVKEAFFQQKFGGIERFESRHTVEMTKMIAESEEVIQNYKDGGIEAIEQDYAQDPKEMRRVKELYNLKKDMDDFGREQFTTAALSKVTYKDTYTTRAEQEIKAGGASTLDEMALSVGNSLSDAVPTLSDAKLPADFNTNQKFGYASVPKQALKSSSKGEFDRVVQGFVYGDDKKFYAVVNIPDKVTLEDLASLGEQFEAGSEEFQSRAMEILSQGNYKTELVPASKASAYITSGAMKSSKAAAKEQHTPSTEGGGMSGF